MQFYKLQQKALNPFSKCLITQKLYKKHDIQEEQTFVKCCSHRERFTLFLWGFIQHTVMNSEMGPQVGSFRLEDTFFACIANCVPLCWCWSEILLCCTSETFLSCFHLQWDFRESERNWSAVILLIHNKLYLWPGKHFEKPLVSFYYWNV